MILGRRVPTLNVSATGDQHHAAQGCGVSTGRGTQGAPGVVPGAPVQSSAVARGGCGRVPRRSASIEEDDGPVPPVAMLIGSVAVLVVVTLVALWVRR